MFNVQNNLIGGSSLRTSSSSKKRSSQKETKTASKASKASKTSKASTFKASKSSVKKAAPSIPTRKNKAAPPPVPSRKEQVKVLYDYAATDTDELTVKEGDVLVVVSRKEPDAPEGWCKCKGNGKEGLVPENYVKKI